jgi:hypothetical protein
MKNSLSLAIPCGAAPEVNFRPALTCSSSRGGSVPSGYEPPPPVRRKNGPGNVDAEHCKALTFHGALVFSLQPQRSALTAVERREDT